MDWPISQESMHHLLIIEGGESGSLSYTSICVVDNKNDRSKFRQQNFDITLDRWSVPIDDLEH